MSRYSNEFKFIIKSKNKSGYYNKRKITRRWNGRNLLKLKKLWIFLVQATNSIANLAYLW